MTYTADYIEDETQSRIADIIDAQAGGRALRQGEIDRLLKRGVPEEALHFPHPLLAQDVVFLPNGYFEFQRHLQDEVGEPAFTMIVEGADGPIDIVAWQPQTNHTALWLKRAFALGEEQLSGPRLDDEPLRVWRSPMTWLAARRRGLVIVQPKAAFYTLGCLSRIVAEDIDHGIELDTLLTPPKPRTRILVPAGLQSPNRSEVP
jgi:hypothetical protein